MPIADTAGKAVHGWQPGRHQRQPLGVLRLFTPNRFKTVAKPDRPTHATANGAIVELADRHHLGRGTGEERLIAT